MLYYVRFNNTSKKKVASVAGLHSQHVSVPHIHWYIFNYSDVGWRRMQTIAIRRVTCGGADQGKACEHRRAQVRACNVLASYWADECECIFDIKYYIWVGCGAEVRHANGDIEVYTERTRHSSVPSAYIRKQLSAGMCVRVGVYA